MILNWEACVFVPSEALGFFLDSGCEGEDILQGNDIFGVEELLHNTKYAKVGKAMIALHPKRVNVSRV